MTTTRDRRFHLLVTDEGLVEDRPPLLGCAAAGRHGTRPVEPEARSSKVSQW